MFNLLKMDLIRMLKSKSTWIIAMSAVALFIFVTFMLSTEEVGNVEKSGSNGGRVGLQIEKVEEESEIAGPGISVSADNFDLSDSGAISYTSMVATVINSTFLIIFLAIFAVLFVRGEEKNGFIKNIAGQVPSRGMLVLSKLIVSAIYTAMMFLVLTGTLAVAGLLFLPSLIFDFTGAFFGFLLMQWLLHTAYMSAIIGMTVVLNNSTLSMSLAVLFAMNVMTLLYNYIDYFMFKIFGVENFTTIMYLPSGNINVITMNSTNEDIVRACVVAVVFLVVPTVAGMYTMKKRDIC